MHVIRNGMLLAVTALAAGSGIQAQSVQITGFTTGCFFTTAACSPATSSVFQTATLASGTSSLVYRNSLFNGVTVNGFLGIGATPTATGQNADNLGSFTLNPSSSGAANYAGNNFNLLVTFTNPSLAAGSNTLFTAAIMGSVDGIDHGGLFIDFDNTPRVYAFTTGNGQSGTLTFAVNDVSIISGGTVPVTGNVSAVSVSTVPEPMTMTLLATGLVGMGATQLRRRRKVISS